MLTAPYVHSSNATQRDVRGSHDNTTTTTSMIDYTNLYIKNLDPQVTSYDLFKKFRAYGKIISARVMKDTMTGISKGYGFVSYTTMEEANEALQKMNGSEMKSKTLTVTFHTHKKSVHQQPKQPKIHPDYNNLSPPTSASTAPNNHKYPSQLSPPYQCQNVPTSSYDFVQEQYHNIPSSLTSHSVQRRDNPWKETGGWMQSSVGPYAYHTPSMHMATTNTTNASVLVSPNNSPPLIDLETAPANNIPGYFQRRQDNDANTAINSQIQLQKIRSAVSSHLEDYQQKDLDELVDLIKSLKKKELSLCLFNSAFLKQKIDEAYEALELFQNPQNLTNTQQQVSSMSTTPSLVPHEIIDPPANKGLNHARVFLRCLEGWTLTNKKRAFGELLFPYVKDTGVRYAPKVTIYLLDTIRLEDLADLIYDKKKLTEMAQNAYAQSVQQQQQQPQQTQAQQQQQQQK
ncbi:hypothetical protein [Parasitella parasitica]|uniref:Uncharacterized protein n=1 Tax=Parasitella parasitica TaxID=35722 RepID=A0A0B7NUK5_9FUNG|nr:hypothetical protein [Parasitella parasitica]